ncbi:hypothetical protein IAQ61_007859 [Plenodomus lingam]|uniref:uncharacterized protein n=1 Tax=Leptosphaeria maculans TaxID=5022 RepID=UPI00332D3776|nr:hypothetical protein IAQ61_007859 [Plenodomus lingam]
MSQVQDDGQDPKATQQEHLFRRKVPAAVVYVDGFSTNRTSDRRGPIQPRRVNLVLMNAQTVRREASTIGTARASYTADCMRYSSIVHVTDMPSD